MIAMVLKSEVKGFLRNFILNNIRNVTDILLYSVYNNIKIESNYWFKGISSLETNKSSVMQITGQRNVPITQHINK